MVSLCLVACALAGAPITVDGPTGRRALNGPWEVRGHHVQVPYVPNARAVTDLRSYEGSVATYRTRFDLQAAGDYAIRFDSVNHRATVSIDGRVAARHTGNYLPFEARARLAAGRHTLTVRADYRDPQKM